MRHLQGNGSLLRRNFVFNKCTEVDATIFDATRSYGIDRYGIDLDQYAADTSARNSITTSALIAPTASFQTIKPIKQNAPSKPSILGPILGGITTGIGVASGIGGKDYIKTGLAGGGWS